MAQSYQDRVNEFLKLKNQGVPPDQAYLQAFPKGIDYYREKQAADDTQQQAIGATVGNIAGALAAYKGAGVISNLFKGQGLSEALGFGGNAAPVANTGAAVTNAGNVGTTAQTVGDAANTTGTSIGLNTPLESLGGYSIGQALGAAGTAYGAYQTGKAWEHGGEGIRDSTTQLGAGIGTLFAPGIGTAAGAGIGNIVGYGLQDDGWKNDAALLAMSSIGGPFTMAPAAAFIAARRLGLVKPHKTTKQIQAERYGDLIDKNITGAQQYYDTKRMQDAAPGAGTWNDGKYAGQEWTFERAQDLAKENPWHFRQAIGNLDAFGNDWSKYTAEQQDSIVRGLIDNNLYSSSKGLININDAQAAQKIRDDVLAGTLKYKQGDFNVDPNGGYTLARALR